MLLALSAFPVSVSVSRAKKGLFESQPHRHRLLLWWQPAVREHSQPKKTGHAVNSTDTSQCPSPFHSYSLLQGQPFIRGGGNRFPLQHLRACDSSSPWNVQPIDGGSMSSFPIPWVSSNLNSLVRGLHFRDVHPCPPERKKQISFFYGITSKCIEKKKSWGKKEKIYPGITTSWPFVDFW